MTGNEAANIPGWVTIMVGLASFFQIFSSIALIAIALALVWLVRNMGTQLIQTVEEVKKIVQEDVRRDMMPQITGTLKNVKHISDDARVTTQNVTGSVNRVSHLVGTIATRAESPIIRGVGLVTGLIAGSRALRGGGKEREREREIEVEVRRKRRGIFGRK